jgi:hypothetical protein
MIAASPLENDTRTTAAILRLTIVAVELGGLSGLRTPAVLLARAGPFSVSPGITSSLRGAKRSERLAVAQRLIASLQRHRLGLA